MCILVSTCPRSFENGSKKWFCAHKNSNEKSRGPIFLGTVAREACVRAPGPRKMVPRDFYGVFMRTKKTRGLPRPRGEPKSNEYGPCAWEIAFWCPQCTQDVISGYTKSQEHLGASLTPQNEPKQAKIVQKTFVSRARTPKKQNLVRKGTYLGRKSTLGAHIMKSERFASSGAVSVTGSAPSTQ